MADISKEKLIDMLTKMRQTRFFEEKVAYFFSRGMIHGTTHLSIGQEGSAIGACAALEENDLIGSTHRGHGHCIGKGIDLNRMMAELLGKEDGYCKGKGGSMHIADLERGNLGANGIVGGGIPVATGAALTVKYKKQEKAVLSFFGDGALNQGCFHESVNLASIWQLPIIYFCENNTYGMSMHVSRAFNIEDLSERAGAYGIKGLSIDGNKVLEVYETVKKARAYVREKGPILIISNTYRIKGHSKSDANRYRTKEEIAEWERRCPIKQFTSYLEKEKMLTAKELSEVEKKAQEDIEEAVEYAKESPYPSIETIKDDVYAS
jgi:pyruvate dehydrogenase E1 component alpha subunit